MSPKIVLDIFQLKEFLLNVATVRPVFIWGPPGIGKSSVINQFSTSLDFECVNLLGSQLASEDLIGVPKIIEQSGMLISKFIPPSLIVRDKAYCLFIDELNIASSEIQKAFYSLILDKRVGEYKLPSDSIVIGAGNRAADSSLVKQMPAALINRMIHVHLTVNHRLWLEWAYQNNIHPLVTEYISLRPKQLSTEIAPTNEEPFSTPRSWEAVSDGLKELEKIPNNEILINALIYGSLTPSHAQQFNAFRTQNKYKYDIPKLLKGDIKWPSEDRDVLLFLVYSVRDYLYKELPKNEDNITSENKKLVIHIKDALKKLSHIDTECAQHIISPNEDNELLPQWFLTEISKELPKLLNKVNK